MEPSEVKNALKTLLQASAMSFGLTAEESKDLADSLGNADYIFKEVNEMLDSELTAIAQTYSPHNPKGKLGALKMYLMTICTIMAAKQQIAVMEKKLMDAFIEQ